MLEPSSLNLAVETMVLFELSIIDIALLIAITIIMILDISLLLKPKPSTETTINRQPQREPRTEDPAMPPATMQHELPIEEQERPERPIVPEETPEPKISVEIPETPETPEKPEESLEYSETPTTEEPVEPTEAPESREETPLECPHYFGYLKKFPKNVPIPDECLGCLRIVECLCR